MVNLSISANVTVRPDDVTKLQALHDYILGNNPTATVTIDEANGVVNFAIQSTEDKEL